MAVSATYRKLIAASLLEVAFIVSPYPDFGLACRFTNVTNLSLFRGNLFNVQRMPAEAAMLEHLALTDMRSNRAAISKIATCYTHITELDLELVQYGAIASRNCAITEVSNSSTYTPAKSPLHNLLCCLLCIIDLMIAQISIQGYFQILKPLPLICFLSSFCRSRLL